MIFEHAKAFCDINIEHSKRLKKQISTKQDLKLACILPVNNSVITPATPNNFTGIHSSVAKKQRAVALETAVFSSQNPECLYLPLHERNINVLTDTAAQRSLISKDIVDKLKLKVIRHEPASLQGFNNNTPKKVMYKVVEIVMGKAGQKPIKLDALVVKSLNSIHMTGACEVAKRLDRKGLPLADFRFLQNSDIIAIDLLIGNDYRNDVVSPKFLPRQEFGMALPRTIYGDYILSGRLPGPNAIITLDTKSINIITLYNVNNIPTLRVQDHE